MVAADPVEWLADHVAGLVAENRHGARVPQRDQAVAVGAYQTVAERHGDPLEAAFGDPAQQASKIDLVERHRGKVGGDGHVADEVSGTNGELRLQQHGAQLGRGRQAEQDNNPQSGGMATPQQAP